MSQFKHKILLIQADTTQTLPIARNLAKKGYEVHAIVSSKLSYGFGSRFIKKKFIFKDYENIDLHFHFILNRITAEKYSALIAMADHGAVVLSTYKKELQKYSSFKCPTLDVFNKGYDKHNLMETCKELGIPHPKTITVNGADILNSGVEVLKFPVLIKPNFSCGARGITYVTDLNELFTEFPKIFAQYGDCHIQEFIPAGGSQVKAQLYLNDRGELVAHSVIKKLRWYPNKGGSSCCNISIENDNLISTLYRLLKEIGWTGFADFDTIEDPRTGELLIMEINPRVPACIKTAFKAGIDWADIIISEYLNKPHINYTYQQKICLRHLGFETLWFLKSDDRFSTNPSWFKFFGNNIFYQDMDGWNDPMPFLLGSIGNIIKQLSPSFRKAKAGM